ncbi:MAG: TRAP transporter large permease [Hyphomicrobiaceae bacterium]
MQSMIHDRLPGLALRPHLEGPGTQSGGYFGEAHRMEMSWQMAAVLLLGGSMVLLSIGVPVALSFVAINIVGAALFLNGDVGLLQVVRNSVVSVTNFSLTPIPLFILMGEILFHTGLALKVIDGVERIVKHVPGRLAVIAVVAGTVFSAISGSTIATTAMLGSLMLPVMLARGYRPAFATGPIMAIGAVDMLIPPSALTVLLGSLSGISISKLLIGGVVPGLILSAAFVVYIVGAATLRPAWAPATPPLSHKAGESWRLLVFYVLPLLSIFVVVVGAMSGGWATPTESAALGALATLALALIYRALTIAALMEALKGTAAITGMILFIILGAITFSQILSFSGATDGLVSAIMGQGLSAFAILVGMMAVLIFLGIFVDQVSMMLITLPVFMPIVQRMGIDPIWFGVLFLICMQLGLLLPPHGLLLMTMKGVSPPQVTMTHIYCAVVPYVAMSIALLALLLWMPQIATWLPNRLG